jgi:hypothetical protein
MATQPVYLNPSEFANKYRTQLIVDLGLCESITCPYCIINYPNGDYSGNCYYEDGAINCAYEYKNTSIEKINKYWVEGVLKDCYRAGGDELKSKWAVIFQRDGIDISDI